MNNQTTLHFRAENFEATATMVYTSPRHDCGTASERSRTHWVITADGALSYSVRVDGIDNAEYQNDLGRFVWLLTTVMGWEELHHVDHGNTNDLLALAISLLYSVPGVEVYEPKPELCQFRFPDGIIIEARSGGGYATALCKEGVIVHATELDSVRQVAVQVARWRDAHPWATIYADGGALGKSLLDELNRVFGLGAVPLPKGAQ